MNVAHCKCTYSPKWICMRLNVRPNGRRIQHDNFVSSFCLRCIDNLNYTWHKNTYALVMKQPAAIRFIAKLFWNLFKIYSYAHKIAVALHFSFSGHFYLLCTHTQCGGFWSQFYIRKLLAKYQAVNSLFTPSSYREKIWHSADLFSVAAEFGIKYVAWCIGMYE